MEKKVDKEAVKALKREKFSYLLRMRTRPSVQCTQEGTHDKLGGERCAAKAFVKTSDINKLSDAHQHQEVFNSIAARHPLAKKRAKSSSVSEKFFVASNRCGQSGHSWQSGEAGIEEGVTSGLGRQVDYRRGEMLFSAAVNNVMRHCAEEGLALQPKHFENTWIPPKRPKPPKSSPNSPQPSNKSGNEVPPSGEQKRERTETDEWTNFTVQEEEPSLKDDSNENEEKDLASQRKPFRLSSQRRRRRNAPYNEPKVSREELDLEVNKLKNKRIEVRKADRKKVQNKYVTKSAIQLKKKYKQRFDHMSRLIKKCEECAERTRKLREKGLLTDALQEEEAAAEELKSQRELLLTKQEFAEHPVWRPQSQPPKRPSSAFSTTRAVPRSSPRGPEQDSDLSPVPPPGRVAATPPRQHQNQIKWHQNQLAPGPEPGASSAEMTGPILPVKVSELIQQSSGEESEDSSGGESEREGSGGSEGASRQNQRAIFAHVKPSQPVPSSASLRKQRARVKPSEERPEQHESGSSGESEEDEFDEQISLPKTRFKRRALMGPRAKVAEDNNKVSLHKSQMKMEVEDFINVYGKDAFKMDHFCSSSQRDSLTAKRAAFTIISDYLMENNRREREEASSKDNQPKPLSPKVLAKDTFGIMEIFLKDMKRRHEAVQKDRENSSSEKQESSDEINSNDSTTKDALIKSYQEYCRRKQGHVPNPDIPNRPSEVTSKVTSKSPETLPTQPSECSQDSAKKATLVHKAILEDKVKMLENRMRRTKERKEQVRVETQVWLARKMDELMGKLSVEASEEMQMRLMTIEISLLFRGFEKLDKSHDGFLSTSDLVRFCKQFEVDLRSKDIASLMWLMDDNRRGKLTFDDVMKFYIRNREEFLSSAVEFHQQEEEAEDRLMVEENKVINTGFGAFGAESDTAKHRCLDGEGTEDVPKRSPKRYLQATTAAVHKDSSKKKQSLEHKKMNASETEEVVVKAGDVHCQPLLLFRILFFVAMQNSEGSIHLLSAFQSLSQLFGRVAEEKFNCIFLQNCLDIDDSDRITLSGFVEHMKQKKLEVKRVRLQTNVFK